MDELVDEDLVRHRPLPREVGHLLGERQLGERLRGGEDPLEEWDVDHVLHAAEVEAAEGGERAVAPPVDLLPPLDEPLHHPVGEGRLERREDDAEDERVGHRYARDRAQHRGLPGEAGVSANLEGIWRCGDVAVLKLCARTSGVAATAALMARFAVTTFRPTVVARKSRWLCTDVARAAREMRPSIAQPVRLPRGSWRLHEPLGRRELEE